MAENRPVLVLPNSPVAARPGLLLPNSSPVDHRPALRLPNSPVAGRPMLRLANSPEAQPRMRLMLPSYVNSYVESAVAPSVQDPDYYKFNSDPRIFTPEYVQRITRNIIETLYSTRDGSRIVYKCADDVGKQYIVKQIIGDIVVRGDFINSVKRYEMIQSEGFPFVLPLFYAETFKRSSARIISGTNILITDYVTSESLDKIKGNTKSLSEIKSIRTQLESILSEISARGYVHRDIKGENIVVTPDNRVYLIDFDTLCKQDHPAYSCIVDEFRNSGGGGTGCCAIGDRRYTRLRARTRPYTYVPDDDKYALGMLIEEHLARIVREAKWVVKNQGHTMVSKYRGGKRSTKRKTRRHK